MLLILDPALFRFMAPDARELDELLRVLRGGQASIPRLDPYWTRLQKDWIEPCRVRADDPRVKQALALLDGHARRLQVGGGEVVEVSGFRRIFGGLPDDWPKFMEAVLSACVGTGEDLVVFTRLVKQRNAQTLEGLGSCRLVEKTVWRLRIRRDGGRVDIPLIRGPRNLDVPWTCRYDERLPAEWDGARFPFCPLPTWNDPQTAVHRTRNSRPCWQDAQECSALLHFVWKGSSSIPPQQR